MQAFDWSYVFSLFHDTDFWWASFTVVKLAVLTWVCSTILGLVLALGRVSRRRALRVLSGAYVWLFRSLPLLVLLVFVANGAQVFPSLQGPLSSPFLAGFIALLLHETAYIAEIHRSGLIAVASGQGEAARALGLRFWGTQLHIVVPQAFRVSLPALGNEFITILKQTSLVSAIALTEILLVGQRLYTQNFKVLETLLAVAVYYVVLVSIFDGIRAGIERRLDVTKRRYRPPSGTALLAEPVRGAATRARRTPQPIDSDPVIETVGLTKSFGDAVVLDGVDLRVYERQVVAVIGPSGSGKTTLIRTMNALELPTSGDVTVLGEPMGYTRKKSGAILELNDRAISAQRSRAGMVFQQFNLFPHLTARENVALAPNYLGLSTKDAATQSADKLLGKVGLAEHAGKYPYQLSGGQQQRVAIARALAVDPAVLLFDEPTSALDPELVGEVLDVMIDLAVEGMTMVVVTHEMEFARNVADWDVFMDQGRIVDQGTPQHIFAESEDPRLRKFLSRMTHDAPAPDGIAGS